MWVPDPAKNETFFIRTDNNDLPQRFTSSVSGKPRGLVWIKLSER